MHRSVCVCALVCVWTCVCACVCVRVSQDHTRSCVVLKFQNPTWSLLEPSTDLRRPRVRLLNVVLGMCLNISEFKKFKELSERGCMMGASELEAIIGKRLARQFPIDLRIF